MKWDFKHKANLYLEDYGINIPEDISKHIKITAFHPHDIDKLYDKEEVSIQVEYTNNKKTISINFRCTDMEKDDFQMALKTSLDCLMDGL